MDGNQLFSPGPVQEFGKRARTESFAPVARSNKYLVNRGFPATQFD